MDYDMDEHVPSQIDLLIQCRSDADIDAFDHVLKGIKILCINKKSLIVALEQDLKDREIQIKEQVFVTINSILSKAGEDKTLQQCLIIKEQLNDLERKYNTIMINYMDDVLTTITTYQGESDGGDQ